MDEEVIFQQAVAIASPRERAVFLDRVCAGNHELRRGVESLLQAHDDAGSFLERPAAASGTDQTVMVDADQTPAPIGSRTSAAVAPDGTSLAFLSPSSKPGVLGSLGQYDVLSLVGRGGMGIVLKAHDTKLSRIVAVKLLAPELAANATARKRFGREARAAAAVKDPHVVTIHAVEEDAQPPYLVMEMVDGKSLRDKIEQCGQLDVKELLRIGSQIAGGLAAAHKQGLIHRDIKPANILLENGVERVKITDFGLARASDDLNVTRTGEVAGTPQYMSPEQAQGEHVDHRADLFSLGSVLYTMCTGRPPFRGDSAIAVIRRVVDDAPRPIREINPEMPDWLCGIVDRLLAKKAEDRYQTAAEVAALLEQRLASVQFHGGAALGSEAFTVSQRMPASHDGARRAGKTETTGKRRTTLIFGIIAAALLLFCGGPIVALTTYWLHDGSATQRVRVEVPELSSVEVTEPATQEVHPSTPASRPEVDRPQSERSKSPLPAVAPFTAEEAEKHVQQWSSFLGVPAESRNAIGMRMRLIPPGEFLMGSTEKEIDSLQDVDLMGNQDRVKETIRSEAPQRKVVISKPFLMSAHEVTVAQFRRFVDATGYRTVAERTGGGLAWDNKLRKFEQKPEHVWNNATFSKGENYPVIYVTREDVDALCEWLGSQEKREYVLPDEEQWEYACRAGTTMPWFFGDDAARTNEYGWTFPHSGAALHPTGRLTPNAFGLFDTIGNVWEFTRGKAGSLVVRGGEIGVPPSQARSASRAVLSEDDPNNRRGFRVAVVGDLKLDDSARGPATPRLLTEHFVEVVGAVGAGMVWGTDIYTMDSSLPLAAVHAGVLSPDEAGLIRVSVLPGQLSYTASARHGVDSSAWGGAYPQSMRLESLRLSDFRKPGTSIDVNLKGRTTGEVFGTDVYSDNSDLGAAAVHSGAIQDGEIALVKVTFEAGRDSYTGSARHGVTSTGFGKWPGSFRLKRVGDAANLNLGYAPPVYGASRMPPSHVPMNFILQRGQAEKVLYVRVTGAASGAAYGTDVYSDDSDLAAAAVHAGVLRDKETGTVRVTLLEGRGVYVGSTRNGVTSIGFSAWPGSYRVDPLRPGDPFHARTPFDAEQAKKLQESWAKHLGVPVDYTNSVGMTFRLIPPGEFSMGSNPDEVEAEVKLHPDAPEWGELFRSSLPRHRVILNQPFYLGTHEVTQEQYLKIVGKNPSGFAAGGAREKEVTGLDTTRFPVDSVSWDEAREFCAQLAKKERGPGEESAAYDLPTEAAWEYAARAGSEESFWTGKNPEEARKAAWHDKTAGGRMHAVGELPANPFGLFDVHGNAAEWCRDFWDASYYEQFANRPATDPQGPADGKLRVIRPGAYLTPLNSCAAGLRFARPPSYRIEVTGFRVSLDMKFVQRIVGQKSEGSGEAVPKVAADSPDRAAARWVLDRGGTVTIRRAGAPNSPSTTVATASLLPSEPFHLVWAQVRPATGRPFDAPAGRFHLDAFKDLKELQALTLIGSEFGSREIRTLPLLPELKSLQFTDTGLNDNTLASLPAYPNLETLNLFTNKVTSKGLKALARYPLLETVSLEGHLLDEDAIEALAACPSLRNLNCNPSDRQLELLKRLDKIQSLQLLLLGLPSKLTAAGLEHLADMPQLRLVMVGEFPIGEKEIEALSRLKQLRNLMFSGSAKVISPEDLERLRKALPDCIVSDIIRDTTPAAAIGPAKPAEFAGTWDSRWGVITLVPDPASDKPLELLGHYYGRGASLTGTVDPQTRTMKGTFHEKPDVRGTIRLVLLPDGQRIVAHYGYDNEPVGAHSLSLTRTGAKLPPMAVAPFDAAQAKKHQEAWAAHLGVPVEYTNSLGTKLQLIPPGEYTRGASETEIIESLASGDTTGKSHGPRHVVVLTRPVYAGLHEVTQKDYETVMGTNPAHFAATGPKKELADKVAGLDTSRHPVENVSWLDAAEFCQKLSQRENLKSAYFRAGEAVTLLKGPGYRLPTEAEWEFFCRAGTTSVYWMNDMPQICWFNRNSGDRTHAVGELKANPFGLFDVHGNVREWVQDLGSPTAYEEFASSPAIDPKGPTSSGREGVRGYRGGSWTDSPTRCRSSTRAHGQESNQGKPSPGLSTNVGFRVVLPVEAVRAAEAAR